jgi:hypothetical protein
MMEKTTGTHSMATLTSRIKLAEFSELSETDKQVRVHQLVQGSVAPSSDLLKEQQANLANRIHGFEAQYKISSHDMRQAIRSGSMEESADFCSWLMLLELRDSFEKSV